MIFCANFPQKSKKSPWSPLRCLFEKFLVKFLSFIQKPAPQARNFFLNGRFYTKNAQKVMIFYEKLEIF
jgi:hypothetical protein